MCAKFKSANATQPLVTKMADNTTDNVYNFLNHPNNIISIHSVPARLGKGQGAKEIGHNLAREQPKFGHNLVRKRHKIGHTFTRERPKCGLVGD